MVTRFALSFLICVKPSTVSLMLHSLTVSYHIDPTNYCLELPCWQVPDCGYWWRAVYVPSCCVRWPSGICFRASTIYFYVNEITSSISPYSRISLFADDISFYCSINAPIDYTQFQDDISAIVQWVKKTF